MFVRQRTIARFSSKIQSRNGKALVALSAATACVALTQRSWADTYGSNGQLNLSQASSWIDETTPANTGVDVPSSNDIAQFDSDAALSATTTFTLGAQTSWLGLSVINPGAAVVIGGGSDTGNTLTIGADGINMSAAAQNLTLSDPLNLNTTQSLQTNTGFTFTNSTTTSLNGNLTVTGSGNATFTGAINAGSNNITMNGTGTLTLTAANAITGNTTLNSGTIYLATASGNATTNSSAGTGTIFLNGGTVHFTGSTSGANGYYNPIVVGSATTTTIAGGVQLAGNITGTGTLDIAVGSGSTVSLMATAGMLSSYDGYIEMGTSAGALRFNGVTGGSGFGLDMGTATATLNTRTAGTFTIGSLAGGASTIVEGSTSSNSGDNYTIGGLGATTTFAGTLENGTDGSSATTAITLTGGSLTLTGTDTYSGGTTISGGTLQIGNNTTSGSFGSGAVSDGSALVISRSDAAVSFSNAISGTGSLTNNGSGTVTLTGNNSFGGGTTISAGVLQADNATSALGTGAVLVGSSATLGGIGNITAAVSIASGASLSPGDAGVNHGGGAGVGTLTMSSLTLQPGSILNYEFGPGANDLTDVTGSNGLTVNGGGINLYQANSTSPFDTDGTYDIFQLSSAYSGSVTNLLSVLNAQGGVSYTWGSSGDFITLTINGGAASTAWNMAGGSSWAMARNWTAGVPNSVGASATLGSAITGPSTITLDGSQTVGTLVFNNNSGGSGTSYTVAAGANSGNLTFDNGGSTATAYISDISGNHAISAPVTLNSQLSVAISSATNTLTISGAIGGVGGINESGNGIVVLSGNNTYGGTTTITSGTLQVGAGGTTGSLGTNTSSISDSAVLAFNMSGTTTLSNVVTGSGALTQEGTGTLILATDNTYTGATNINSGTVQIATGETTALNNGNVAFGGTGGVLDINGNNISIATISGTV
jgi:autotransporter-associated beta strand protein